MRVNGFFRSSLRLHRFLLAASFLVPALVFLAASAWNWQEVQRENREAAARSAVILHEHARKVFDTVDLALALVVDRVRGLSWDEIAKPETSRFLRDLKAPLEQAVSIWITDPQGFVRAGSQPWDPRVSIAEREWFQAQKDRDAGLYVSAAFMGKATRTASFAVSRRRETADGRFDGIVHVALSPEYFSRFFAEAAPEGVGALLRSDGEVLARYPFAWPMPRVSPDSPLMKAMAAAPAAGQLESYSQTDQRDRYYAYRQVTPFPVFVVYGVDAAVINARWLRNVALYGVVSALAALVLVFMAWLALQRAQAEQQALLRLREESENRLLAEQRLLQAQKMESIGQLTGGVAHDFNNLLAVIIGNIDLVRRRLKDDERARRLLDTAMQGAQRGASLTQRLLAFARRQDLSPRPIDVAALVRGMQDLLARSLGPDIRLRCLFPEHLPPVTVDPGQLEMAVLNLAVNARDAMAGGGELTISAHAAKSDGDAAWGLKPGDYVCIRVADSGAGMSPETLARAVEPFFTTKGVGKGTGLGLSMIHGFAHQSGGALKLSSEAGGGTVAEIWLPRSAGKIAPSEPEAPSAEHRACTVLLVEDDPLVMAGVVAMLEDLGHAVVSASSGEAALDLLDEAIDLVITDQSMPGISGTELARRVRNRRPDMPILLVSGHAEAAIRTELNLPRLAKPFLQKDLAAAIAAVVTPSCEPAEAQA